MIATSGLTKSFGSTRALDGLDLQVDEGEVHGFLGPNGSGKSTTIRVLLGLLRADGGTATMLGGNPWTDIEIHRRIAYVPGDVNLWPNLTGGEVIDLPGIIRSGKVVETATLEQMRRMHTTAVRADVRRPVAGLDRLPGVSDLQVDGARVSFTVDAEHLDEAIAALSASGLTSLVSEPPSLEELFASSREVA